MKAMFGRAASHAAQLSTNALSGGPRPVPTGGSPDATLAAMSRSQWQHYLNQFGPLEDQLVDSIDSNALVDQARVSAGRQAEVGAGSLERTKSRFGLGGAPGAVQAQLTRQQQLGTAADSAQAVNTAKIDQRDRNLGTASQLMQLGRGVASQGLSGMSDAAGLQSQRNAQNAQMKANQQSGLWGFIGSL